MLPTPRLRTEHLWTDSLHLQDGAIPARDGEKKPIGKALE
jgi:hypothetical protein